jgi:hypothetical protein
MKMGDTLNKLGRMAARGGVLVSALTVPAITYAQNCSLCYTQAAGSGSRMIAALKSGILILVAPPMLICLGIAWMAYKKRNQFNEN